MASLRIGPDGSIIKDDVVLESEGNTIIREDGTIETTHPSGHAAAPVRPPVVAAPPVSPLALGGSSHSANIAGNSGQQSPVSNRAIKEKEYDIQMIDGRIRNAIPKNMVIATVVLLVLTAMGWAVLIFPALITGGIVAFSFVKRRELEQERARMYRSLQELKRRSEE